ncbi:hypothetical protein H9Q69_002495 [Fusarium xylarioides]|uniref:Uncharacterized protein n=1 Tax=Fusarium xylarioides TaxID=221167 RepID=A0A9P7HXS0_9HYPO|nr:hypothetical protein H9Q70_010019 [Fusarium xylarioides]KAG5768254.1 hypothetical protein H9Q72_004158 [Fusarium xylarioides]KAG5773782.1 hypothetical protein H9Q73_011972 [Fusarium xylarioides]KAG5798507.1 hypothetical protein H9Q69_002495 [Fusarium xylarioides]
MSLKMESEAESLATKINDETVDICAIGVDVCKNIPFHNIIPASIHRLHQAITTDILRSVGFQRHEAESCFLAICERINSNRPLRYSTLDHFEGMSFLQQHSSKAMILHASTKKIVCPPAHVMGCVIVAVAYRKLHPSNEDFFQENKDFVKVFGELNGIQWLSVAIRVFHKVRACAFTIELDENSEKPVAKVRKVNGESHWVVKTRMPEMNRYESILRNALCPAAQPSGPAIPKLESDDSVLPTVEPNDTTNEPIPLSDDDETEDNAMTLRDYTRQMKILGKRLATPDRAVARRARKEIMKKPGQVGEQEVEDIGLPKEYFDSYTHLKDV